MKFKKIKAVVTALAVAASVTACSNEEGQAKNTTAAETTRAPEQSFAEATAAPVDETAPTGTIKMLLYEDIFSTASDMTALFESRYGGSIDLITTESGNAYFEALGTYIATGDSPDIVRYEWRSFPHAMSYNMYTPLDTYIDLDSDLWKGVKEMAEQFAYNGKHFYIPYTLKTNYALNYNNRILQEYGITDPMTLFQKNEWTWKSFESMLKEWCDLDPNHIGYNGVEGMSFILTTGTKLIDIKDGEIFNNTRSENVARCLQWLEGLRKGGLLGASVEQAANGATSGFVSPQSAFVDGNLLFLGMDPTWTYSAAKEYLDGQGIENEIKFVPYPRDDLSDTYYHGIDTFGYMVPSGAPNVKGAIDWITLNRVEETDEDKIANAKAKAIDTSITYYPICSNSDCGDTANPDSKGRHIFTDEENETGVDTCPSCSTPRREKYKVTWSEEQYDLWLELKSLDGRFSMLFDHCYGFTAELSDLFYNGETGLTTGPLYYDASYTSLIETSYNTIEAYIQPYRDRMAADAKGEKTDFSYPTEGE